MSFANLDILSYTKFTTPLPMSILNTGSVYRGEINRPDEHSTSSCEEYTAANVNTEYW